MQIELTFKMDGKDYDIPSLIMSGKKVEELNELIAQDQVNVEETC